MDGDCSSESELLVLIRNIPPSFHSKDLRRYFSTFVEAGRFACFHYRHRPENLPTDGGMDESTGRIAGRCCLVRIFGGVEIRIAFIRAYDGKNWTDEKGDALRARCRIQAARLGHDEPPPIELKPPIATMPQGNVGTPTNYFLDSIRQCRLPASLISKLGLVFPKTSGRRVYSNVPPPVNKLDDEAQDHLNEEGDDEAAEEWERHEAQYDDVTDQERTKERLYEEDLEVVWEKGGPGLVFYTDAYLWDQQEPDTDEKWVDDWDVDTNVYVDPTDADKDARDSVAIRREAMLRAGQLEESAFKKKAPSSIVARKRRLESTLQEESTSRGRNERSFGRKIMEKHGWRVGSGLGATVSGKVEPVHDELKDASRLGFDKRGIGFYGEKINRRVSNAQGRGFHKPLITTVYDDPSATDPPEVLLNRHEPSWNKHR